MSRTSSALAKIKDQEYERQMQEKNERANRLKEARRKYSKQKLKSKQRSDDSCTVTSQSSQKHPLKLKQKNEYDDSELARYL